MKPASLEAFARGLGAALAAPNPLVRLNEHLNEVLSVDAPSWMHDEDHRLVRRIAERLDAANANANARLTVAINVLALLDGAGSSDSVETLLEIMCERERAIVVLQKHLSGRITRTGLLSFIAEQSWNDAIKRRIATATKPELETLTTALQRRDVPWLAQYRAE